MTDYTKLVKALRGCKDIDYCTDCPRMENGYNETCNIKDDAADTIEELQAAWIKSETDATNLTGRLAQAEADIDGLNLEIDKRIATEIELSNQVDALQAEVDTLKRTDSKRCQECLYLGQPVGEQQMPKRGKWMEAPTAWKCSVCEAESPHTYPFCPFCGSIMRASIYDSEKF